MAKRNLEIAKEEDFPSKLLSVLIMKKMISLHKRSLAVFKAFSRCLYFKGNISEGEDVALDL